MEGARAVSIVKINNGQFELNDKFLVSVLNHPDIKDKKLVVVSIAGASCEGNHFLLAYFLDYLNSRVCKKKNGFLHFVVNLNQTFSANMKEKTQITGLNRIVSFPDFHAKMIRAKHLLEFPCAVIYL